MPLILTPIQAHVLVRPLEGDELKKVEFSGALTRGGGEHDRCRYGEVVKFDGVPAVIDDTPIQVPEDVSIGSVILYERLAAHKTTFQGEDYEIIRGDMIYAVVQEVEHV